MAGLLDFLQSASNTAASNVSAPVDGLAWLLRKAGIPVNEPVGGSDWMQRQGLTRPVEQSGASLAGETMGLLAPIGVAANAPKIARGLLQMGENAAAPTQLSRQAGVIGSGERLHSSDWAGLNTPEHVAAGHADDMMRILKEDIASKDFDPSGVRQGLIDWAKTSDIHPRYSLQAFLRSLNADKELKPFQKQSILGSFSQ